jgi:hypothetical protein
MQSKYNNWDKERDINILRVNGKVRKDIRKEISLLTGVTKL